MWRHLRTYFLTGIAVLLPAVLTILVLQYIWNVADHVIVDPLYKALPFELDPGQALFLIKSLILLVVVITICLVGFATNILVVKEAFRIGEWFLERVPMVNRIYSVLKDISSTIFVQGKQRELFRSAVLIEYPRKNLYSIAFITRSGHPALSEVSGKELTSVFLPTTPNPTSGILLFLPKEEVTELPISIEEAIRLVISAGTLRGRQKSKLYESRFVKRPKKET